MTTAPNSVVPELTLGWRLRMALETSGLSRAELAERLGYEQSALSRWMHDKGEPRRATLAQWALLTGVSQQWLETGEPGWPTGPSPGEGEKLRRLTDRKARRARFADNPEYLLAA